MLTRTLPPGPPGRLFSGSLRDFSADRLGFLTRCARDYGDVVAVRFGPRRIYLLSHPDAIEEVLVTGARHFRKHFALRLNPLLLGNGLLTSEGDFWLRQRRLCQPAFQRGRVAAYAGVMTEHTRRLLEGWREGEARDVFAEMTRLTLGIAAKTLFGADADRDAADVGAALAVAQDCFVKQFSRLVPLPVGLPTPVHLRMRRAVRRLDQIIYRFLDERRKSGEYRGDVLSMLLHAQDEDRTRMRDKQLRDEAMTLFLAGHETTALTLSWAWYLLATHPEAEARLAEEVAKVLGGRPATADDQPRLPYAEWVILEAMRLYPPAYVIGREALEPCEVAGYPLPEGMTVLMSQWVVQRDPRWWDEPERFRPERWADHLAGRLPRFAYFPFGGGPRVCIGQGFALLEAVLVLATIAQHYRFTLAPGAVVRPAPNFTLRPVPGVPAVLARR